MQPLRDVDAIRTFLSGQAPVAILDMPWMPLYLAFVFLLHPVLGWVTVAGALFLISHHRADRTADARATARPPRGATRQRWSLAEASERNAEVLQAMGFAHRFMRRLQAASQEYLAANERLSDIVGSLSVVSRVFRLMLQSALLGLGAYLTINGEMTAGAIIACSIAASRALAPIEVAIGNWRGFVAARRAPDRLDAVFLQPAHADQAAARCRRPPVASRSRVWRLRCPARRPCTLRNIAFRGRRRAPVAGGDRPERGRQVDARRARSPACGRWRGARCGSMVRRCELVARGAGQAHRLSAAGRAAVRRHHYREHRALRGEPRQPQR